MSPKSVIKHLVSWFETSNAPVICNPGYSRAWEVPETAGLKYRDFVWKLRCPSSVYYSGCAGLFDYLPNIAGELAGCRDFRPENFPAVQSIYAGFVERNVPAIPRPLGSRGSKGLLHKKVRKCLCKRGTSL